MIFSTLRADNALKSIYLGVMAESLNTKINPLLTKIEQTTCDVWGKEIRTVTADDSYLPLISTLKNLYATVKIPEKVIKAADGYSTSIFIDLLNASLEECLSKARIDIAQMIYGDGTDSRSLTGIGAIFDITRSLYGQERDVAPTMRPLIKHESALADVVIEKAIDELDERGAKTDFIAVSRDVKYAYIEQHKHIDIVELNGGYKALSYQGIPLVYDKFVPQGTMYLLDTSAFRLHQLCDWRWFEGENGYILRQSKDETTYEATLVKYCDLICHRPDRQGMIKFTEN